MIWSLACWSYNQVECYKERSIEIPFSDLKLTRCDVDDRDVYLYTGDLNLNNFSWDSGKISEWSYQEVLGAVVVGAATLGGIALIGKLVYDYCTSNDKQEKDKKSNKSGRISH